MDGNSPTPDYPKLAGQYPDYLAKALRDYKSGARKNPIMAGFAAALTKKDIDNLAAYYASQPRWWLRATDRLRRGQPRPRCDYERRTKSGASFSAGDRRRLGGAAVLGCATRSPRRRC